MSLFHQNHLISLWDELLLYEIKSSPVCSNKRTLAVALSSKLLTLKTLHFLFALCHGLSLSNWRECLRVKKMVSKWSCKYSLLINGNCVTEPHTKNASFGYTVLCFYPNLVGYGSFDKKFFSFHGWIWEQLCWVIFGASNLLCFLVCVIWFSNKITQQPCWHMNSQFTKCAVNTCFSIFEPVFFRQCRHLGSWSLFLAPVHGCHRFRCILKCTDCDRNEPSNPAWRIYL